MKGKGFFPWPFFSMAPWLQVAIVLAQLCTLRLLAVSLWHDQTWKPVVWRLSNTAMGPQGNAVETAVERQEAYENFVLFCF